MADFSSLRRLAGPALRAGWAPIGVVGLFLWLSAIGRLSEFDNLVHGLGGASVAFAALVGLSMRPRVANSARSRPLLAFGIACGVAALWEVAEFVADRALGTSMQHGVQETIGDIVSGFVGAGAIAIVAMIVPAILRRH